MVNNEIINYVNKLISQLELSDYVGLLCMGVM